MAMLACFSAHDLSVAPRTFTHALPSQRAFLQYPPAFAATGFVEQPPSRAVFPDLYEASIAELQHGLERGHFTSVDLVKAYFARIEEVNTKGPELRAVLELNPSALAQAAALDLERVQGKHRGPLHGIPVLLKDNIATRSEDGMNTTAGSYALLGSVVPGDATVAAKLREAGAVFMGKANLSEWSQARGEVPVAWSAIGGQCTNAYYPKANPCGSSSGSGVAASIGLAAVTLGTETDGSITCPSSFNNVVGIKPTVGLTSRNGVIPIMEHQDTVGPIVRSVADAAIVLSVIAGRDAADNYTLAQPEEVPDFTAFLDKDALRGARLGVPRYVFTNETVTGNPTSAIRIFNETLAKLERLGAIIVDPADIPTTLDILAHELNSVVFATDFKIDLNRYLEALKHNPSGVRSLSDLIEFNDAHPELEKPTPLHEGQNGLIHANGTSITPKYFEDLAASRDLAGTRGIDFVLKKFQLDALVMIGLTAVPAAIVGYPIVTLPMGFYPDDTPPSILSGTDTFYPAPGVPIGVSFVGSAFSEPKLIGLAYAFEQAEQVRLQRRAYPAAIPKTQLVDVIAH
ncbi:amidase signature enzyme [Auricularia subglabra TFB-10046 SS5]|nr:amidase signature enzyme [Auricularia subglabra TFB-10046 SS5]